jgi:hypothetical protein
MCIVSFGLIADVGISGMVTIGTMIRSAKITGIAPKTKIMGFTIHQNNIFAIKSW